MEQKPAKKKPYVLVSTSVPGTGAAILGSDRTLHVLGLDFEAEGGHATILIDDVAVGPSTPVKPDHTVQAAITVPPDLAPGSHSVKILQQMADRELVATSNFVKTALDDFEEPEQLVDSAYSYVRQYVDWAHGHEIRKVVSVVISTQPASGPEGNQEEGVVSYASGWLSAVNGDTLAGELVQYFSDRTADGKPFSPHATDRLGVKIISEPVSQSVTIQLAALSWGGDVQTLTNCRLDSGVLMADGASVGQLTRGAVYAVTLGTITPPG